MLGRLVVVYCLLLVLGLSSKVEDVVQRLKPEIRKLNIYFCKQNEFGTITRH